MKTSEINISTTSELNLKMRKSKVSNLGKSASEENWLKLENLNP